MEKVIPSQGDGEQFTKFGGPWPAADHPTLFCRLVNEFPLFTIALTTICKGCWSDRPVESDAETVKAKVPAVVGVPEISPLVALSDNPEGSCPDAIATT